MEKNENSHALKETVRIEAFSDAVFSIAITLLILEIHVPVPGKNETLLTSVLDEWPSFLALLIGFFTLLICWINHHYMFTMIHKTNSVLALFNGFKLLIVTITPFATALLAKNIEGPWSTSSVCIYCFNFSLMGTAMTGIWLYAKYAGFIRVPTQKKLKAVTRLYIFASLYATLIWLVSFISTFCCMLLFCIMFFIFIFPEKIIAWQVKRYKEQAPLAMDKEIAGA
jgi:uncharacterized membrane protein